LLPPKWPNCWIGTTWLTDIESATKRASSASMDSSARRPLDDCISAIAEFCDLPVWRRKPAQAMPAMFSLRPRADLEWRII
jgi:hypothetical protein